MKRVLINGGAGFIGSPLTDELFGRGHRASALTEEERANELHARLEPELPA